MQLRFLYFFLSLSLVFSCDDYEETKAIITSVDLSGNAVSGASVWLSQNGQISPQGTVSNVSDQQISDSRGKTEHVFDNEKVLNIYIQKIEGNNTLTGEDVIKLIKNETVFKTVRIN